MPEIHFLPIITAAFVAFFASFIWYILFAKQRASVSPVGASRPDPKKIAGEFVKNIVLAAALSYLVTRLGVQTVSGAVHLSILLWVAFPVLILVSSVMYEKVPLKLAAIHSGDWIVKLLLMIAVLGFWH